MVTLSAEAREVLRLRRLDPELETLFRMARLTRCRDWAALYDLLVTLVGPCRRGPGDPALFALATFDLCHDQLWFKCRLCRRSGCQRCLPTFLPNDQQILTARRRHSSAA